jgi:hypothetical protein
VNGKVREAIQQSVARILVGGDGSITIAAKPGGLLGLDGNISQVDCQEGWNLREHRIVSPGSKLRRVITAA